MSVNRLNLIWEKCVKIAILTRDFPPKQFGGTETASYDIAKSLAKRGHEALVITTRDSGLPSKAMEDKFLVHRVRFSRNKILRFPGLIFFSIKTFLILRRFKPDIIHSQSIYMGVPGLASRIVIKKPHVLWLQGSDVYLPWLFQGFISKLILSTADVVIALTDDMRKAAQKVCNREILVIPNGVDLERFEGLSRAEARRKLELKEGSKVIIFVGILYEIKGVRYLIEAMKTIKQECSEAQLLLVGDGIERQDLELLVHKLNLEQCVTFAGLVPNERVPEYLCASDLFVLPSLSEGFPVTVLEAMACGLPILTTYVRGLPEIINDGENGFLIEPQSSAQIAEKASFILRNDILRERMSRNNRECVRRYDWESIGSSLEEVYSEITRYSQPNKEG